MADEAEPGLPPPVTGTPAAGIEKAIEEVLGTRYRWGGESVETGFDCSGFVVHVFRESLGQELPRTTREISRTGRPVRKTELAPGDLVFFNTLRRTFSHVGIYLGNHLFAHAPRNGGSVRVEDLRDDYWAKRYNGARRVAGR